MRSIDDGFCSLSLCLLTWFFYVWYVDVGSVWRWSSNNPQYQWKGLIATLCRWWPDNSLSSKEIEVFQQHHPCTLPHQYCNYTIVNWVDDQCNHPSIMRHPMSQPPLFPREEVFSSRYLLSKQSKYKWRMWFPTHCTCNINNKGVTKSLLFGVYPTFTSSVQRRTSVLAQFCVGTVEILLAFRVHD